VGIPQCQSMHRSVLAILLYTSCTHFSIHGLADNRCSLERMADQSEATQLQFTVLYGTHSTQTAHCYLLEVSGVKILLDCGWDSNYDPAMLEPLEKVADKVALVLISHANLEHLGALPYAYRKFKLTAPCYMTSPVVKLGQLALYDAVLNGAAPYSLDEIDVALSSWKELKYKEPGRIDLPTQESIVITPHGSGRTLGGAVWSIVQEPGLSVLYVSDIYQRRERFLDGIDLNPTTSSLPRNPTLLIQDGIGLSKSVQLPSQPNDKQRDAELVQTVLQYLRKGGDILIPVDSSSRVIEILLVLDAEWTQSQLSKSYELVFLTQISSLVDMVNSHVEWTSRKLQEHTDITKTGGVNPLRFTNVAIVDSVEEAFATSISNARLRPPRVIVCAGVDLEKDSFSRRVFLREFCPRPNCLVLLACESFTQKSLAKRLAAQANLPNKVVTVLEERVVDLEGEELAEYLQKKRVEDEERKREQEAEVELMDFEQNAQVQENLATGMDGDVNDFALVAQPMALQRAPSLQLTKSSSLQSQNSFGGSVPDAIPLIRSGTYREERVEEMLTFSFIPPSEIEPEWDEYGAKFDLTELMGEEEARRAGLIMVRGKRVFVNPASSDGAPDALARSPSDAGALQRSQSKLSARVEPPELEAKKRISVEVKQAVRCDVKILDFDARMSAKDLFDFVDYIKPSKLVIVRAALSDAEKFAVDCQNKPACGKALTPAPGECLDIAADSSVVRVRVADETIQTSPASVAIGGFIVQRLQGKMAMRSTAGQSETSGEKRRRVVTAGGELPTIVPLKDPSEGVQGDSVDLYFVSKKQEPNWGAIMDRLNKVNVKSQLRTIDEKLVLMCGTGDQVVVWKPGDGQFIVGGPLCETYFSVRKALYDCFALV
jgi:cleavage and polyadenylation specificity factor subunit 2